jgi:outer membrane protein assembly factor BamB
MIQGRQLKLGKNKIFLIIFLSLLLFCVLAQSVEIHATSEVSLTWSSRRNDAENTAFNQGPAPDTNQTLWTNSVGSKSEGNGGGYIPSAAVGYGKIFVGDRNGVLHALDELSGESFWVKPLESGDIFGPALAYNKVFVVSEYGTLFAIDEKTGEILWKTEIAASPSINVADDRLFIAAFNGSFYCVNATSGVHIWSRDIMASSLGTYTITHPAVADGRVFVGVICLNETDGATLWTATLSGQIQGIGSRNFPAVTDGKVFIGVDNTMYCLDKFTGSVLWNYTTNGEVFRAPPALAYGKVFVPSTDGIFYCLDAQNGTALWMKSDVGGVISIGYGSTSAGAAVADGKIYLPNPDWAVTCINATNGELVWRFITEGPPAPPIVADGTVFVTLVHDPQIYAIGKSSATDQTFWLYSGIITVIVLIVIGSLIAWRNRSKPKKTTAQPVNPSSTLRTQKA